MHVKPVPVTITLAIIAGVPSAGETWRRPGARRWWVQGSVSGWVETERCPGTEPAELTATVVPGERVIVGTGDVRVRFAAPLGPCTVQIDPQRLTATVVAGALRTANPPPLDVSSVVVDGCAALAGVLFPSGAAAFAAIGRLREGERVGAVIRRVVDHATAHAWDAQLAHVEHRDVLPREPSDEHDPIEAPPTPVGAPVRDEGPIYVGPVGVIAEVQSRRDPVAVVGAIADAVVQVREAVRVDPVAASAALASIGIAPPPRARFLGVGRTHQFGGTGDPRTETNLSRNVAVSHAKWSERPLTVDALRETVMAVAAEQRTDLPIPAANELTMRADGAFVHPRWTGAYLPEPRALRELVADHSGVMPRAGALMSMLPPGVRADVWNAQVPRSSSRPGVLRTRVNGDGQRQIYAAVSPGYAPFDADQLCGLVSEALATTPGGVDARGEVSYDPSTTETVIDAVWHQEHRAVAVGDTFQFGVQARGNDAGNGSIRIVPRAWRGQCDNGATIEVSGTTIRVVHRGARSTMVRAMRAGIERCMVAGSVFLARWTSLRTASIRQVMARPSDDMAANVRSILGELAGVPVDGGPVVNAAAFDGLILETEGIQRDVLVESLLRGWAHEPGDSLADIVNAVTRLHTERVPVPVLRAAEDTAGQLVNRWAAAIA